MARRDARPHQGEQRFVVRTDNHFSGGNRITPAAELECQHFVTNSGQFGRSLPKRTRP